MVIGLLVERFGVGEGVVNCGVSSGGEVGKV